jgi:hypothetical protein
MRSQEEFDSEVGGTTTEIVELSEKSPEAITPEKIQEYRDRVAGWISEKAEAAIASIKPDLEGSAVSSLGLSSETVRAEADAVDLDGELAQNEKSIRELAQSVQESITTQLDSASEGVSERSRLADEEALLHGEIGLEQVSLYGGTTGGAVKVEVAGLGSAVFKTFAGEGGPEARQKRIKREVAAYELNKALGLDLVEPTVEKTINGEEGSLQVFIDGAKNGGELSSEELNAMADDIFKLEIFDNLMINTDRPQREGQEGMHPFNFLAKDGHIKGIDHAEAFNIEHAFNLTSMGNINLFEKLGRQKVPKEIQQGISHLLSSPERVSRLREVLTGLLGAPTAEASLTRIIDFGTSISQDGSFSVPEFKQKIEKYQKLRELIDTGVMYE